MGQSEKITFAKAAGLWLALSYGEALVSRVADRTGLLDLVDGLWGGEVLLSAGLILYCLAMGAIGGLAVYYSLTVLHWLWGRFQRIRQRDIWDGRDLADRCAWVWNSIGHRHVGGEALAFRQRLELEGFALPSEISALQTYLGLLGPHAREFGKSAARQASESFASSADAAVNERRGYY